MKRPKLLAVGGAHVDRRGQVAGPYAPGASNPGRMREDVGGGAFNALRNAVQRGIDCSLMSVRGANWPARTSPVRFSRQRSATSPLFSSTARPRATRR